VCGGDGGGGSIKKEDDYGNKGLVYDCVIMPSAGRIIEK
jgi:hypothetical protein